MNRIRMLTLFLIMGGSRTLLIEPAEALADCQEIKASQTVSADLSSFSTTGTIRGTLKGTTQFTGDSTSLTPVLGTFVPPLNPTLSYTGTLVITTRKGTLTTRSVGVFENVPFGVGTQFDRVVAGTGRFQGATGVFYFTFKANGDLSDFTSSVTGELCLKETLDNDVD
jgi:hypothetical protein